MSKSACFVCLHGKDKEEKKEIFEIRRIYRVTRLKKIFNLHPNLPPSAPASLLVGPTHSAMTDLCTKVARLRVRDQRLWIAINILVVCVSYVWASVWVSPQVVQANRAPHSHHHPVTSGGGYCFHSPCDPYMWHFRGPTWENPTHVIGQDVTSAKTNAFYGWLALMVGLGSLSQESGSFQNWMDGHLVWIGRRVRRWRVRLGDFIGGTLSLLLCGWWLYYDAGVQGPSLSDHVHPLYSAKEKSLLSSWGSYIGSFLNLLLGMTLVSISRPFLGVRVFGQSWEDTAWFHRWVGAFFVGGVLAHGGVFITKWVSSGHFDANVQDYSGHHKGRMINPWNIDGMKIWLLLLPLVAVTATPWLRRWWFYLFYFAHLSLYGFVALALVHSWSAWVYATPGLLFLFIDKASDIAFYSRILLSSWCCSSSTLSVRLLDDQTAQVSFSPGSSSRLSYAPPGSTVWVCVPSISGWQRHPFSLPPPSPDARGKRFVFVSRVGGWTSRLLDAAKTGDGRQTEVPALVQVPFGPFRARSSRSVINLGQTRGPTKAYGALVFGPDHFALNVVPESDHNHDLVQTPRETRACHLWVAGGVGMSVICSAIIESYPSILHRAHASTQTPTQTPSPTHHCTSYLLWTVRHPALAIAFSSTLSLLAATVPDMVIHIHVSSSPPPPSPAGGGKKGEESPHVESTRLSATWSQFQSTIRSYPNILTSYGSRLDLSQELETTMDLFSRMETPPHRRQFRVKVSVCASRHLTQALRSTCTSLMLSCPDPESAQLGPSSILFRSLSNVL